MKNAILKFVQKLVPSKIVEPAKLPVKPVARKQGAVPFTVQQNLAGFVSNPGITTTSYVESRPLRQAEPVLKPRAPKTAQELWGLSPPVQESATSSIPLKNEPTPETPFQYRELKPKIWLLHPYGEKAGKGIDDFKYIVNDYFKKTTTPIYKWNFSSTREDDLSKRLIALLSEIKAYDLVVIVVGGGAEDSPFYACYNNAGTALSILEIQRKGGIVVTGLGHKNNEFLIDDYADFPCITPTEAGIQVKILFDCWRDNRPGERIPIYKHAWLKSKREVVVVSTTFSDTPPRGLLDIMHVLTLVSVRHVHFDPKQNYHLLDVLDELATTIKPHSIVAVISGGGEVTEQYYDNFRHPNIREKVRALQAKGAVVISGIGHATDDFFIDQFVDGKAITPTHAGYLTKQLLLKSMTL